MSNTANHTLDDQKKYPGKLETNLNKEMPDVSDGQAGNARTIVPQGVKLEPHDPTQNHQPSGPKQKKSVIKMNMKRPTTPRKNTNKIKNRQNLNKLVTQTLKFPQLSLNLLNMLQIKPRMFPRKQIKRKTNLPPQPKRRKVTDSIKVEDIRPSTDFSPPDRIDTGFTPYFKSSAPFNEKEYLANITTPSSIEQTSMKVKQGKKESKVENKTTQKEPLRKYGIKVKESPKYNPNVSQVKRPYGVLRKQSEGEHSHTYVDERNFASSRGQINIVPEDIAKYQNSNYRSKPKTAESPSYFKKEFQSNFNDFNFDSEISPFSLFSQNSKEMESTVPKHENNQESYPNANNKLLLPKSQRRAWNDMSFDDWDKDKSRKYQTTEPSLGNKNFKIAELRNSNFRRKPKKEATTIQSTSNKNAKFKSNFDNFSFDAELPPFSPFPKKIQSNPRKRDQDEYKSKKTKTGLDMIVLDEVGMEFWNRDKSQVEQSMERRQDTGFIRDIPGSKFLQSHKDAFPSRKLTKPQRIKEIDTSRKDDHENPILAFKARKSIFSEKTNIDNFFADVEEIFPSVGSFGENWESTKLRNKRETENSFFFPEKSSFKNTLRAKAKAVTLKEPDFSQFRGRDNFETDFFNVLNSERKLSPVAGYRHGLERKHLQQDDGHKLEPSATNRQENVLTNEILGSGNYEIVKGGTYYETDAHLRDLYRHNPRPQDSRYYRGHFKHFRDFADIKRDKSRAEYLYY